MTDDLRFVSHWGIFSDESHYHDELEHIQHQPGSSIPGVFLLPPNAVAILFADGFWSEINSDLGTLLDFAEEEELSPPVSARMAHKILALARSRYHQGLIRKVVARREPDKSEIWAEIQASELADLLVGLANFLIEESNQGKVVIASL